MKVLLLVSCFFVSNVLTAPQGDSSDFRVAATSSPVTVIRYYNENKGLEGYRFTYELSDGQIRSEAGGYKDGGLDKDGNPIRTLLIHGAYSHVASDGETYWVNYESDENGYRPKYGKGKLGGIKPGEDIMIDPNLLKSLIG